MTSITDSLHHQLVEVVKTDLASVLNIDEDFTPSGLKFLLKQMFKNYRENSATTKGLRLTYTGLLVLRKHYTCYKYSNNDRISNQALLVLDKEMQWPYYVSSSQVVFFSENDAAWFRLNGENLNDFVDFL